MMDIKQFAPHAVEVKMTGPIDQADIEKLETALDPYLPDEGSLSAVIDLSETGDNAGLVDKPKHLDRLLSQFDKFARIAVVQKDKARDGIMQTLNMLMPDGSMQQFEPARVARAREFAAHLPRGSERVHPAE